MKQEDSLQVAIANYLRLQYPKAFWCHPPNGGKRNVIEAAKFKKMGVRAGLPDILIFERIDDCAGLFLELKAGKNKETELQIFAMNELRRNGWIGWIVYNFDDAKVFIDAYLKNVK